MFKRSLIAAALVSSSSISYANTNINENQGSEEKQVEVISVTAQMRSQSIQDVPISMSAFGEDTLDKVGADSFADLTGLVPGISIQTGTGAFPITYIRGIGTNDTTIAADPSIGVYIDGVYAARLGGALTDLLDIQRIELLKGPQGTLFGRNSIGGAISITTNKPSEFFEGSFGIEYGSFNTREASGVLNIPIIDNSLYLRAVGAVTKSDGWQENTFSEENGNQQDRKNLSLKFVWFASDDIELSLSSTFSDFDDTASYTESVSSLYPSVVDVPNDRTSIDGNLDLFQNPNNNLPANIPIFQRELEEHWLNMNWQISAENSLKSLTTFRDYTTTSSRSYDGIEFLIGENLRSEEDSKSVSQEIRFTRDAENYFWVLGSSYFKEEAGLDFVLRALDVGALQGTPFNLGNPITEVSQTFVDTESWAIFTDINVKLHQDISLTLGARYSDDRKTIEYANGLQENGAIAFGGLGITFPTPPQFVDEEGNIDPSATNQSDSWTDFSPRIVLDYKVGNTLYYASVTRGYKSGAFNSFPSPSANLLVFPAARNSVAPEEVTNYEVGFKSSLLDRNLILNGSFYSMDYDELQVFETASGVVQLANAGEAKSRGFELDGRYAISGKFGLNFNASWMDAEYVDYQVGSIDYSGTPLLFTPKFSGSVSLDYVTPFGNLGDMNAFITYSYKGDHLLDEEYEQEAYALINAQLRFISSDGDWEVAIHGNNLTDEVFFVALSDNVASLGATGAFRNVPRNYNVSFKYRF